MIESSSLGSASTFTIFEFSCLHHRTKKNTFQKYNISDKTINLLNFFFNSISDFVKKKTIHIVIKR